ncbi:MAG: hydantoinase B/oxoprolinase family protein [archaeon]|nr:hydantoinase B/oxoprolinase family protein [archaeon]
MQKSTWQFDPATLEVFANAVLSISEEMGALLIRTAYSPNIKERRDCSCALFDSNGKLIAQADHNPIHLGALISIAKEIAQRYSANDLNEGDVFLANDAYHGGGTHLVDVTVASPVFFEGKLVGFVASMGHWPDVGGRIPGAGGAFGANEIFQEGLRIPPVRIMEKGKLRNDVWELLSLNIRFSDERMFDFKAQIACNNLGIARLKEVFTKYGIEQANFYTARILDYTEEKFRSALLDIPAGTYSNVVYMDDDGISDTPVKLSTKITIKHGKRPSILLDFSGSSPQRKSAINLVYPALLLTVYYVLKAMVDPTIWANSGYHRAIEIIAPEGSIVNAKSPAPVSSRITTCQALSDGIIGALAKAVPHKAIAGCHWVTSMSFSGYDPIRKKNFVYIESLGGGNGARSNKDGLDAVQTHTGNIANFPIEVMESEYPLQVLMYEIIDDSAGPGKYRGGLAERKTYLALTDMTYNCHSDHYKFPANGIFGGKPGRLGKITVNPDSKNPRHLPSKVSTSIKERDIVRCETAGGGGYGAPTRRKRNAIVDDIRNGFLSPQIARKQYGVVLNSRDPLL